MSGPGNTTTLTEKSFQQSPTTHMPHPHAHDLDIKINLEKNCHLSSHCSSGFEGVSGTPDVSVRCPNCNHWSDVLEAESRWLLVMVVWRQERERERAVIEAPGD